MLDQKQKDLIWDLLRIGAINFDFEGGWRLKLHEKYPDFPLSPLYIDLRVLQSYPKIKKKVVLLLAKKVGGLDFDYIAGIPLSAVFLASSLADYLQKPQITPRLEKKTHGEAKAIDGVYQKGKRVLLLDDLITLADSKLEAIKILQKEGLKVRDIAVVLDRQQGGREQLEKKGYRVWTLLEIKPVLEFCAQVGKISQDQARAVLQYLDETKQQTGLGG